MGSGPRLLRPAAVLALVGFASTVVQVLVLREYLVAFYGNELSLGLVLALWLLGFGLGGLAGVRAGLRLGPLLVASAAASLLVLPGALGLTWLALPAGGQLVPLPRILLSALALVVPFGFLLGLLFPAACARYALPEQGGRDLGLLYVADALGSMAGGAASTLVFAGRLEPVAVAAVAGCGFAVAALVASEAPSAGGRGWGAAALAASLGLLAVGGPCQRALSEARFRWSHPGQRLLAERDTPYQHLALSEAEGQYNLFSDGRYWRSFPDERTTALEAHLALLLHPGPTTVVVLGGGLDGFLAEALLHGPEVVYYLEQDGALLPFLRPWLPPEDLAALSDARVRRVTDDPRRFLLSLADASLDLLLVRLPEPESAQSNRCYTAEFYALAARKLRPGGMLVCSSAASANYLGGDLSAYQSTVLATLATAFPVVATNPGDRALYVAGDRSAEVTLDVGRLASRLAARPVRTGRFTAAHLGLVVDPSRVDDFDRRRAELPPGRINRDAEPAAYCLNLALWDAFSASGLRGVLDLLRGATAGRLSLALVLVVGGAAALARRAPTARARGAAGVALATVCAGGAAMVADVVLLLAYQNRFGSLYQSLGLAVALFMAGLAAGGLGGRALAGRPRPLRALQAALVAAGALALAGPSLLDALAGYGGAGAEAAFLAALFLAATLPGLQYPLAAALAVRSGLSPGAAGGLVNGADVLGGAAGAAAAALVLVPVVGFAGSLLLVAVASLAGALALTALVAGVD